MDIREIILNNEYNTSELKKGIFSTFPLKFPDEFKQVAINAMDENGKRLCLELLGYMANQQVDCRQDDNGNPIFIVGPILRSKELTKEQLFENFL